MSDKFELYDAATTELVNLAQDYDLGQIGKHSLPEIIAALRAAYKNPATHEKVFGVPPGRELARIREFLPAHQLLNIKPAGIWNGKL